MQFNSIVFDLFFMYCCNFNLICFLYDLIRSYLFLLNLIFFMYIDVIYNLIVYLSASWSSRCPHMFLCRHQSDNFDAQYITSATAQPPGELLRRPNHDQEPGLVLQVLHWAGTTAPTKKYFNFMVYNCILCHFILFYVFYFILSLFSFI